MIFKLYIGLGNKNLEIITNHNKELQLYRKLINYILNLIKMFMLQVILKYITLNKKLDRFMKGKSKHFLYENICF